MRRIIDMFRSPRELVDENDRRLDLIALDDDDELDTE